MNANSLVINKDETKILVITNNPEIRNNIKIEVKRMKEPIKPIRSMVYLGITVQDNLKWNIFLTDGPENLIKKLSQKLNAIKIIRRYIDFQTTKMLLNGVFLSTLLYGASLWIGAPSTWREKSNQSN